MFLDVLSACCLFTFWSFAFILIFDVVCFCLFVFCFFCVCQFRFVSLFSCLCLSFVCLFDCFFVSLCVFV